jgi:small subunit ribosomal protein S1
VHISDISWNRRAKNPADLFKKGDSVRALILSINTQQERFSLGIKQLEDDPWQTAAAKYPVGKKVTGKVNSITDFGVFIEIQEGIDGLIHSSQANIPKNQTLAEHFKLGDELTAKIISNVPEDHKIGLTLKFQVKEEEAGIFKEFADRTRTETKETLTFGSAFENLDKKLLLKQNQPAETEESKASSDNNNNNS